MKAKAQLIARALNLKKKKKKKEMVRKRKADTVKRKAETVVGEPSYEYANQLRLKFEFTVEENANKADIQETKAKMNRAMDLVHTLKKPGNLCFYRCFLFCNW